MGYELDKLLKQYGVSSAFTPTYTGTAKPAAGEVGPSQYTADKALFDKYKASYQERMGGTPMYAGAQYQTQPAATSASVDDLYSSYLGRAGDTTGQKYWEDKFGFTDQKVRDEYAKKMGLAPTNLGESVDEYNARTNYGASDTGSQQPKVSLDQIKEFVNAAKPELAGRNFGSQALMDVTGSYYGGQLQSPTYANYATPKETVTSPLTLSTTPVTTPGMTYVDGSGFDVSGAAEALGGKLSTTGGTESASNIYRDGSGFDVSGAAEALGGKLSTTTAPATMSTLGTTSSGVPSQSEVTSGGPTSGFSAANYTDVSGAAIPWYLQSANVALPDAQKAAALQGITLTAPTLAELASRNKVTETPDLSFNAANYASPTGGSVPWYSQTDNYNLPDAAMARAIAGVTSSAATPSVASTAPVQNTGGFSAMNFSQPWYMQAANYNLPDAVKARAAAGYSHGGQVKTNYYRGDRVDLPDSYDMDGMELAAIDAVDNPYGSDQASINRASEATDARIKSYLANPSEIAEAPPLNVQPEVAPVVAAPAEVTPAKPARVAAPGTLNLPPDLAEMLSKYTGGESVYGKELSDARTRAETESKSFNDMLEKALAGTKEEAPSKAEMYFRLAAAFGKPTKTGHFAESLGNVGEVLGEQAKEGRAQRKAERALKLQLGLKGQEARMAAAKEDVTALRGLASEEMKDKRAIATELLKQHIASGLPQSSAGKQALDEGFIPKTDKFKARVAEISQLNIEKAQAAINAAVNGMSVAQANLTLQNRKFEAEQEKAAKLTPGELKLKVETEDVVAQTDQALKDLKRAYELNPNTFDATEIDTAQRKLLEAAKSDNPKLANTREQENLLQKAALSQLKSTFPGSISNDERKALLDIQGVGAKSLDERKRIMKNAYNALKAVNARHRKRLDEIKEGRYRDTTPPTEELE